MKQSITVAIVTRNRAKNLEECLRSLAHQTHTPGRIFIVDNASSDDTQKIIAKNLKNIPIRSVIERGTGYPIVYNRALREVKTRWVTFIYDDCIADARWFDELTKATKKYYSCAAIIGASKNYYSTNPYACTSQFWYDYWRRRSTKNKYIADYRTLDSRNVVFNRRLLLKHNLAFDPAFIGGAEDSDLGLQIQSKGQQASYVSRAIVYHKEPTSFISFFRKKRTYAVASRLLTKKWSQLKTQRVGFYDRFTLLHKVFRQTTKNLSLTGKIYASTLIATDYLFSRLQLYEILNWLTT